MNKGLKNIAAAFLLLAISTPLFAETGSEDNIKIPADFPSDAVVQKSRDQQDFQRAITAYHFWYPTVSTEAIFNGNRMAGIKDNEGVALFFAKPRHVGFTLNSDTPYAGGVLDLADGPVVVELPAGPYVALVDDHHQRWILDMGIPGQDQGRGGKYLILPPGYKGEIPAGYAAKESSSLKVYLAIRFLPLEGDEAKALASLQAVRIYPLSTVAAPKLVKFVDLSKTNMDSTPLEWETNLKYWEVLSQIINTEPVVEAYRPMYGLLAAIGIEKGRSFFPDERMKNILEQAAKEGHEQMMVSAFSNTRPDRMAWSDRKWEWASLVPGNVNFETPGGLDLDARDRWFAQAIVSSPAMFKRAAGSGSLSWLDLKDSKGVYLNGGDTYKLTVPLPVPSQLFWSLTVYDVQTRSEIQTDQNKAALRSLFEIKNQNGARSVDLYFGPSTPSGKEGVWIKTVPGKNWFAYFRVYGPEQSIFEGGWRPGDFVKTNTTPVFF